MEDEVIFEHLFEISEGKIDLKNSDEMLSKSEDLIRLSNKRFGRQKIHQSNRNKKYRHKRRK